MKKDYSKLWVLFKSMFVLSACTVSYTHLDVYKRQVFEWCTDNNEFIWIF